MSGHEVFEVSVTCCEGAAHLEDTIGLADGALVKIRKRFIEFIKILGHLNIDIGRCGELMVNVGKGVGLLGGFGWDLFDDVNKLLIFCGGGF